MLFKHTINRRNFIKGATALLGASALYRLNPPMAQAAVADDVHSNPGLPTGARPVAQAALIDDFSTGPDNSGILFSGVWARIQAGSMLGGRRLTRLTVADNPREHPVYLDIGSGFLNWSTGIRSWTKLEVIYGKSEDGKDFVNDPLHVDLSGYAGLQVNYDHLVGRLDAHVTIYTGAGRKHGLLKEGPGIQDTFSRIYRFDDFIPPAGGTWNLADVHVILFMYTIEGDVSISSIELI